VAVVSGDGTERVDRRWVLYDKIHYPRALRSGYAETERGESMVEETKADRVIAKFFRILTEHEVKYRQDADHLDMMSGVYSEIKEMLRLAVEAEEVE
jgi:hypothetical protein